MLVVLFRQRPTWLLWDSLSCWSSTLESNKVLLEWINLTHGSYRLLWRFSLTIWYLSSFISSPFISRWLASFKTSIEKHVLVLLSLCGIWLSWRYGFHWLLGLLRIVYLKLLYHVDKRHLFIWVYPVIEYLTWLLFANNTWWFIVSVYIKVSMQVYFLLHFEFSF